MNMAPWEHLIEGANKTSHQGDLLNLLKKLGSEGYDLAAKIGKGATKGVANTGKFISENPIDALLIGGLGASTLDMAMNQDKPRYAEPVKDAKRMAKKQGKYGF